MDFRPLTSDETIRLRSALRNNAESDNAILTDPRDTSFVGTDTEIPDTEVISAIRSVPTHY